MRMRKKPNLAPRMDSCRRALVDDPTQLFGVWKTAHREYDEVWLELGCGKGRFTMLSAQDNPHAIIIAIERISEAIIVAMERVCDAGLQNARFINCDARALPVIFAENEVDRIFINFCDPWKKSRYAKNRLTAPGFLKIYESILKPGGEIHFKTDDNALFDYSVETLTANGWTLSELTRDLHKNGEAGVMTDYELKFHAQGIPINRLVAGKEKTSCG